MYSDYIKISKNFNASINLELDLDKEAKIAEYIPTKDICDVLKKYVNTALGNNKDYSTTLVGPYGKGKSFLLLVLTYLLGKNKESKTWINLVDKIGEVDEELKGLLNETKNQNISLLPIIINSNYDNLLQSFQLALNDSLQRANLEDLIPNSAFTVCLDLINKWEQDNSFSEQIFAKCLEITKVSLPELKIELRNYNNDAYNKFVDLYNCVNIGLNFNPLVSNDVVKTYLDVTSKLTEYNYKGIFLVFDEFSKFLESNSSNIMRDLKLIQDFAEACSRSSKNQQIHLCCVSHKSITSYNNNKNKNYIDAFRTVEGRFTEFKFNRSLSENYYLISHAIIKQKGYKTKVKKFLSDNKEFYARLSELNVFSDSDVYDKLFNECYPLNPLTAYSLIQLSELVAQNERTLFTFLSDSDDNSFNTFIKNNDEGLFNVDKIYDYFNNIFQKQDINSIKNIWYRAYSLLNKLDNKLDKRIIKVMAILAMINDIEKLPINEAIISLCLNENLENVTSHINELLDDHLIRRNLLNNLLSFSFSNSKQIESEINYLSNTKFKHLDYSLYLNYTNNKRYILPRKYNEENKITRFYSVIYLSDEAFYNLANFDEFFAEKECDGLVINLIAKFYDKKKILNKLSKIGNECVIIRIPGKALEEHYFKLILRYACLKEIYNKSASDDISTDEVLYLLDETEQDIRSLSNQYFDNSFNYLNIDNTIESFNNLINDLLDKTYSCKIKFNNELINKNHITTQYQKAINHVIDCLLNGDEFNYSETSPEASIQYSVFEANDNNEIFKSIIDEIRNALINNEEDGVVKYILDNYRLPPYGIREGIMPLLLSKALSELDDNIIFYMQNKEIELTASNIVKAVKNENYHIEISKSTRDQVTYLNNMLDLFNGHIESDFRKNTLNLASSLNKHFLGLPKIIRSCEKKDNYLQMDEAYLAYKHIFSNFNINPYESVFTKPLKLFNVTTYPSLLKHIKKALKEETTKLNDYLSNIVSCIKDEFDISQEASLKSGLNDWLASVMDSNSSVILEDIDRSILDTIKEDLDYNDLNVINKLSKAIFNLSIEDWIIDNKKNMLDKLNEFKFNLSNAKKIEKNDKLDLASLSSDVELSSMAELLQNNIESIFDEFSDSVSSAEKVKILGDLLNKLM